MIFNVTYLSHLSIQVIRILIVLIICWVVSREYWYTERKDAHLYGALSVLTGRMSSMDLPSEFQDECLSTRWFQNVRFYSVKVRFSWNYLRKKGRSTFFVCGLSTNSGYTVVLHILFVKDTEFLWKCTLCHQLAGDVIMNWNSRQIHWPHMESNKQNVQTLWVKGSKSGIFPQSRSTEY